MPSSENKKIMLPVEGMTCASCVMRVEKTLKNIDGVETANVNLATEKVSLVFDETKTSLAQLANAVDEAGYKLVLPDVRITNDYEFANKKFDLNTIIYGGEQ